MEIGATKAVQDRLKTTKIEESKGASLVFCWDTHLTKIKGRNVLFIVNASNRYTIAMTDIEPRNWNLSINSLNFPLFSRLPAIENSIYVSFSLVFALMG